MLIVEINQGILYLFMLKKCNCYLIFTNKLKFIYNKLISLYKLKYNYIIVPNIFSKKVAAAFIIFRRPNLL